MRAPLQAVDLFAYEIIAGNRFIFEKGVVEFSKLKASDSPAHTLFREPHDWGTHTEENLREFAAKTVSTETPVLLTVPKVHLCADRVKHTVQHRTCFITEIDHV